MADDPVRIMPKRADGFDRKQRPFERGHTVKRDGDREELEHRLRAQFVPRAADREEAVQHAGPRRCPEHQRKRHAQSLEPIWQRGVEQMVRAGPDVDKDQRPKMNHGEPVGIHRTFGRFRHEVIHDAQNRRGQKEGHGVVPIPPLHQRVLHTAEDRVTVEKTRRDREVIDDVEHRHGDDRRDVEPDPHVERGFTAPREGPEKIYGEDHPDQRDRNIDWPDQLGVFLAAGKSERKRDGGRDDNRLPAPKMELGKKIACEPGLHQALRGIVDAGEHHIADEGENDGVGVQRAQTPEGQPRQVKIQLPVTELCSDDHSDQHAHRTPDDGGEQELPDDLVVEFDGYFFVGHGDGQAGKKN